MKTPPKRPTIRQDWKSRRFPSSSSLRGGSHLDQAPPPVPEFSATPDTSAPAHTEPPARRPPTRAPLARPPPRRPPPRRRRVAPAAPTGHSVTGALLAGSSFATRPLPYPPSRDAHKPQTGRTPEGARPALSSSA